MMEPKLDVRMEAQRWIISRAEKFPPTLTLHGIVVAGNGNTGAKIEVPVEITLKLTDAQIEQLSDMQRLLSANQGDE